MTMPTPLTLLIAAREPTHGVVLAEMVQSLRSGLKIEHFDASRPDGNAVTEGVDVVMVVEVATEGFGELSARVRAHYPNAALVTIAPRFDERAISVAAKVDAAAIVTSPCEPVTLIRVLEDQERQVRFAGRCDSVETSQLLRLHAAASSDGVLHLSFEGREGAIYLEDGQANHAHCGELVGVDAVRELLGWAGAKATWIAGRSAGARTISGPLEHLLERDLSAETRLVEVEEAPRVVLDKLERLSRTEDILAVYLLRNTEILVGHISAELDSTLVGRALCRLAQVFHDLEEQQGDRAGTEIQATVGEHRLVVDRLGPMRLGFQVGVVVRQATPVCKSLRRLLRQVDRGFRKALMAAAREQGPKADKVSADLGEESDSGACSSGASGVSDPSPRGASGLHRVA